MIHELDEVEAAGGLAECPQGQVTPRCSKEGPASWTAHLWYRPFLSMRTWIRGILLQFFMTSLIHPWKRKYQTSKLQLLELGMCLPIV